MIIYVQETYTNSGHSVRGIVDEERFKELYGERDLKELLEKGRVGDVIGQAKIYYAVLAPPNEAARLDPKRLLPFRV